MRCSSKALAAGLMSLLLIFSSIFAVTAQASLVTTSTAIEQQQAQYDRESLMQAIEKDEIRDQLISLGVDPLQVEQRIEAMTPSELAQLNTEINELPAGQGVLGVLLTVFIVFMITDMLCATDVFAFVRCINR